MSKNGLLNDIKKFKKAMPKAKRDILGNIGDRYIIEARLIVPVDTSWLAGNQFFEFFLKANPMYIVIRSDTVEHSEEGHEQYSDKIEFGTRDQRAQPYYFPSLARVRAKPRPTQLFTNALVNWIITGSGKPEDLLDKKNREGGQYLLS